MVASSVINKAVEEFTEACGKTIDQHGQNVAQNEGASPAVIAVRVLCKVLDQSQAATMMGLGDELKLAAEELVKETKKRFRLNISIPVEATCEMFLKYIIRSSNILITQSDFDLVKKSLVVRGQAFLDRIQKCRKQLASYGSKFIADGNTVLVHGYSRSVVEVLGDAAQKGRLFDVITTECRPDCTGYKFLQAMAELGIPTKLVMDSAIGYHMERVDLVLVGAEGLMENGGVANRIGTYPVAMIAKAHGKPFYVAAESFKFCRLFPLNQQEIGSIDANVETGKYAVGSLVKESSTLLSEENLRKLGNPENKEQLAVEYNLTDYTPPEYITLIFADIGVLTPSAVSDELIKLYQ